MGAITRSRLVSWGGPGTRATRLELFYDLVFVFAFLNVTTITSDDLTPRALLEALLVLILLWWCWTGFVTIGNALRADVGVMPAIGFAVTAAVFVLALSSGVAFRDVPGGLYGPWLFAVAYLVTWVMKATALWSIAREEGAPRLRSLMLTGPSMTGALLILVAATVPQRVVPAGAVLNTRLGLWITALLVEYSGGLLLTRTGWRLRSVGHAAERHALIVLVALGESVIALGIGTTARAGRPLGLSTVVAAVLGIGVIAVLWWLYFDWIAAAVEQRLHGVRGAERIPLARDIYTYLHLPLIVGIILFALGLKRLLSGVLDAPHPAAEEDLDTLELLVLYGGVILILLALTAIQLRALRRLDRVLLTGAVLLTALLPVAAALPALLALLLLNGAVVAVVLIQLPATRDLRQGVRATALDEQAALEAEANQWRGRHL
ncbi:low temperature requirement protein A [Micromonospora mirobrigensis]|uniref:Low temperature requirement protein LtrA n=1 Tax=Micromonospora mirobrigensis TaxID=262898 RepID=A0A1C5A9U4_9ACTN|nr:low temperature requirement protein A [Micromonospora mirobrigensis]SCF41774.1 Low temperature requirement protein LtrA [Micromonospora mirobrigensis]